MQSRFHIGQKVICVNGVRTQIGDEIFPETGAVYTVREIKGFSDGDISILVEEIRNKYQQYRQGFGELYFREARFAPIENIK